ncbi:hypothetical protein PGT21_019457 [Puccinia graminis f. sp. tritici]|uniref:Uncharacterized protein n=1 Tax=Puccinia graminis f. sp. tritici TaxID=56615 RepID=A0A5B0NSB0_PUCGR|nr:hypothetical protein PGT21_019457 [Puccinia graminis f. sp. tritici]KAA1092111.1 hypothetical protein PGTUg99_020686 [Puccinia graminis f. sp. tritici]
MMLMDASFYFQIALCFLHLVDATPTGISTAELTRNPSDLTGENEIFKDLEDLNSLEPISSRPKTISEEYPGRFPVFYFPRHAELKDSFLDRANLDLAVISGPSISNTHVGQEKNEKRVKCLGSLPTTHPREREILGLDRQTHPSKKTRQLRRRIHKKPNIGDEEKGSINLTGLNDFGLKNWWKVLFRRTVRFPPRNPESTEQIKKDIYKRFELAKELSNTGYTPLQSEIPGDLPISIKWRPTEIDAEGRNEVLIRLTQRSLSRGGLLWLGTLAQRVDPIFQTLDLFHNALVSTGLDRSITGFAENFGRPLLEWFRDLIFEQTGRDQVPLIGLARLKLPRDESKALLSDAQIYLSKMLSEEGINLHKSGIVSVALMGYWCQENVSKQGHMIKVDVFWKAIAEALRKIPKTNSVEKLISSK